MFVSTSQVALRRALFNTAKRHYSPSIKFAYGNRDQIARDVAAEPKPAWFAIAFGARAAPTQNLRLERQVLPVVTRGGVSTRTVLMEAGWVGNPFNTKPALSKRYTEQAINTIQSGGAL